MNIFQENQNCFQNFMCPDIPCQINLFDKEEAFMLGNLFKDLYMSYRGFSNYCLQPDNPRQKALLDVQINEFVAHEINLYLDIYPHDQRMVQLYREFVLKAKEATRRYEKQFGPLMVSHSENKTPFQWVQGPWPWEYQK